MKLNPLDDDAFESEYDDDYYDDPVEDSARDRARNSGYRPTYGKSARRPAGQRDGAFNVMLWLLEGATGVVEELRHNDLGLSEDFWTHAYAARREGLMAARAFLDNLLDEDEESRQEDSERQQRRNRRGGIDVEF